MVNQVYLKEYLSTTEICTDITVVVSIIIVSAVFINAALVIETVSVSGNDGITNQFNLFPKTNNENGVSIDVEPIDFSFDNQVKFDVEINTHQGSLDFDMTDISVSEDNKGNEYKPISWDGSLISGHHRSGTLTFSKLKEEANYIKLTVKDVYDTPERVFRWALK